MGGIYQIEPFKYKVETPTPVTQVEPTDWSQSGLTERAVTYTDDSGQEISAILKQDGTVWRGGEQIGTGDWLTGEVDITPEQSSLQEKLGGAIGAATKGLGWLLQQGENVLSEGSEALNTSWGAFITNLTGARPISSTIEKNPTLLTYVPGGKAVTFLNYLPGGSEYKAYQEWEKTPASEGGAGSWTIPFIPSWQQLGAYLKPYLADNPILKIIGMDASKWTSPEKWQPAQVGEAELAELTNPIYWMFGEVANGATVLEKAAANVTKKVLAGKTIEQAFKESFSKIGVTRGILEEQGIKDAVLGIKTPKVKIPIDEAAVDVNNVVPVEIKDKGGQVVKTVYTMKNLVFADPKTNEQILSETQQLHPNLLRKKTFAITTAQKEKVKLSKEFEEKMMARNVIQSNINQQGNNVIAIQTSLLKNIGEPTELFEIKKMPVAGHPELPYQEMVTSPHIVPLEDGGSMYFDAVINNWDRYHVDNSSKGQLIKAWKKQSAEVIKAIEDFRERNLGKAGNESDDIFLENTNRGVYPRRTIAQYDSNGKETWRQEPWVGGKSGGRIPSDKPRVFGGPDGQRKAIESGFVYAGDPMQPLILRMKGVFNQVAAKRGMEELGITFETKAQRLESLGGEVIAKAKQIDQDIKYLGGGVTRTNAEGKVIVTKNPGVLGLTQRILRGEIPHPATISALDERFPELGAQLRKALSLSFSDVSDVVKAGAPTFWKETGATREKFLAALSATRGETLVKRTASLNAINIDLSQKAAELSALKESLNNEGAKDLLGLIKKMGVSKGELSDLTIAQFKKLTGSTTVFPNILTKDGAHVKLESVLNQLAGEHGFKSGAELKNALNRVYSDYLKSKALTKQIAATKSSVVKYTTGKAKDVITPREISDILTRLGIIGRRQVKFLKDLYTEEFRRSKIDRRTALEEFEASVKDTITKLKIEKTEGLPAYRLAQERAITASFSEGRVLNLPGYRNAIIPKETSYGISGAEIAERLNKAMRKEQTSKVLKAVSTGARILVTLEGAIDNSLAFIQLQLGAGHDVSMWLRGRKSSSFLNGEMDFAKTVWNPDFQDAFIAKHADELMQMGREGLIVQKNVDYLQTDIIASFFKKWSNKEGAFGKTGSVFGTIFGNTYDRFGKAFGAGSLSARYDIMKNMSDSFVSEGWTRREVAEWANKITGVIDPTILGVNPTLRAGESAVLFSSTYTRACLMLVRDLFRTGASANETRLALAGMVGTQITAYISLCQMLGQEPKLNPAPKEYGGDGAEFMTFKIAKGNIGFPGFWYSFLRLSATAAAAAAEKPEDLVSTDWRTNPLLSFWMGRASPLVRIASEIREQKDFTGRRIGGADDWIETLGSHFLTIAAQNLITKDPSEEEGKWWRFGAEIFGLRTFPESEWTRLKELRDEYAYKEFKTSYDKLNNEQKNLLLANYPDYQSLNEQMSDKTVLDYGTDDSVAIWSGRKMADADYNSGIEQAAQALIHGQITYREYLDEENNLYLQYKGGKAAYRYLEDILDPEKVESLKEWGAENQTPEDAALSQYFLINSHPVSTNGQVDWEASDKKLQDYLASLDINLRQYVLRNRNNWVNDLPTTAKKLALLKVQGSNMVEEYYSISQKGRMAYRRANPTVDAWLLLIGRVTNPVTRTAATIAIKKLNEAGLPLSVIPALTETGVWSNTESNKYQVL